MVSENVMDSDRIIKNQFFFLNAVSIRSVTGYCYSADSFVYRYYLLDIKVITKSKKNCEK